MLRIAEGEQLLFELGEIDALVAAPRLVQHHVVLVSGITAIVGLERADLAARELGAPHHVEHPADLLARDHRLETVAAGVVDELGRVGRTVGPDEMTRSGAGDTRIDETGPRPGGRIRDDGRTRGRAHLRGERVHGVVRQPVTDLTGFVVTDEHLIDDLVVAARARGVVRAVQHELAPRDVGESVRVVAGGQEQRRQWFGAFLE